MRLCVVGIILMTVLLSGCGGEGGGDVAWDNRLSVSPPRVELTPGQTQEFSAGGWELGDGDIWWTCSGGTIESSGNCATFTAGHTPGSYSVVAGDEKGRGSAVVIIGYDVKSK